MTTTTTVDDERSHEATTRTMRVCVCVRVFAYVMRGKMVGTNGRKNSIALVAPFLGGHVSNNRYNIPAKRSAPGKG
jgi:hypothetical protein